MIRVVDWICLGHVAVVVAEERPSLCLQHLEAEGHILCRDLAAIMKTGFGAQVEDHPGMIVRMFNTFSQQAVLC